MGFTSTTIFTVVQVWMAKVAEEYAGMSVAAASKMLTYFSLGVVIGVFVTKIRQTPSIAIFGFS
jgi:fucose permease